MSEDTDEDIYDDLETSIFISSKEQERNSSDLEGKLSEALKEIQRLQSINRTLERENKNYSVNISSLYVTAKNEIEKKNCIIKQLQAKLKSLTAAAAQKSCDISRKEIDEILKSCEEASKEGHSQATVDEIVKSLKESKKTESTEERRRKHFKFGNMSLYFAKEQIDFVREPNTVVWPKRNVPQKNGGDLEPVVNGLQDNSSSIASDKTEQSLLSASNKVNTIDDSREVRSSRSPKAKRGAAVRSPRRSLTSRNQRPVESYASRRSSREHENSRAEPRRQVPPDNRYSSGESSRGRSKWDSGPSTSQKRKR